MMLLYHQPLCDRLKREMPVWGNLDYLAIQVRIPASRLGRIMSGPGRISIEDARALGRYWPHNSWYQISGEEEIDTDRIIRAAFMVRKRGALRRLIDWILVQGMMR